jgi:hypothetical protein
LTFRFWPSATFGGARGEFAHGGKADLTAAGRNVAIWPLRRFAAVRLLSEVNPTLDYQGHTAAPDPEAPNPR